jgi:hypothetical protein
MTAELTMDDGQRKRRARNWALCAALAGFALLIYAITLVKIGMQP